MASIDSVLFQLTSGLISETAVPTDYLHIPEINIAIVKYNWTLRGSNIPGWTTLVRVINYSS
jgi:hypothetical protein